VCQKGVIMVRKIVETVPDEMLKHDLEKYRQKAIELGATDAKIITTDMVVVDERVRAKCIVPLCRRYGTNANCPPHTMDLEMVRKIVNKFHHAIFIKLELPSELIAGAEAWGNKGSGALWAPAQRKMREEIMTEIEGGAFYDGYHLAMGIAGGTCAIDICADTFATEGCVALLGKGCLHSLKARCSPESLGIDVFTMGARVGWDIYPMGKSTSPSEVPYGVILGLVFIY
jgi:predicted metal-binding protein